jgi:hypothetical protein
LTAHSFRAMEMSQIELGYLHESEAIAAQGLTYLETLFTSDATKDVQLGLYNHLGKVYPSLEVSNNAVYYYNKALKLSLNKSDSLMLSIT